MGELLRSQELSLVQFFIQSETAYAAVSELGALGMVQFRDVGRARCRGWRRLAMRQAPTHHARTQRWRLDEGGERTHPHTSSTRK